MPAGASDSSRDGWSSVSEPWATLDPRRPDGKDVVNSAIKFREGFRPFAPAILADRVADYFTCDPGTRVPFMEKLLPFRQEKRSEVPSVVHADGTGRLQTVTPKSSPRFYALLQAFDARTGVPVVLNTSFNLNGEPMVCAPDAIRSFYTCALDVLTWGTSASRTDSCIRKARRPRGTR